MPKPIPCENCRKYRAFLESIAQEIRREADEMRRGVPWSPPPQPYRSIAEGLEAEGVDPADVPRSPFDSEPHPCGPAADGAPPEVVADLEGQLFGGDE